MSIEDVKMPSVGESINEGTNARVHKKVGDFVKVDEVLLEVDTEKASVEVPSPFAGKIVEISIKEGETVAIGFSFLKIDTSAAAPVEAAKAESAAPKAETSKPAAPNPVVAQPTPTAVGANLRQFDDAFLAAPKAAPAATSAAPEKLKLPIPKSPTEVRTKMTPMRKAIAKRLVAAKNETAMLTTFNEVDMSAIKAIRERVQDEFSKKHGIKLGFMSFFVKASVHVLQQLPIVNSFIDSSTEEIVNPNSYDISVAIGTDKGLVVPVIKGCDTLSFADIEKKIKEYALKAKENKLTAAEMGGGSFTITNGGTYGSLLSTPIINIPQSAILGMHGIQERPVAINGKVEIRPMMYLALSYDHRIMDGKEAVTFLVQLKKVLENPEGFFLEI